MLQCKVKPIEKWKNETIFTNPKCGHVQRFEFCTPARCQRLDCNESVPDVERLFGINQQAVRLKYYVEGKI